MKEREAIIYLAENRNSIQTETFRSLSTLPNSNNNSVVNSIIRFADNTLLAQETSTISIKEDCAVILLPLVGSIEISEDKKCKIVNPSEIAYIFGQKGKQITVQNPYENEMINYLEIWIRGNEIKQENVIIHSVDLEKNRNKLVEIPSSELTQKVFIGKYSGREEGILQIQNNAFIFVINGIFEVNNCLLDSRDGFSLSNIEAIEFEGLGTENIILILPSP